jgi:predicted lipoprotein with Yx(FWY)xxD motif
VLSIESTGKLHCTGACLKTWPPDLVKSSTKSVSVGKGVKGKVGFVKRSSTTKQVTFNGFPVYRFSGDKKAKQANGEGIVADGGTWTLVSAAATKASTTPVKEKAFLTSVNSSPYTNVLATTKGNSLYVLSAESGGTLHCTGNCLSFWPPLLVGSTVKSITLASGITGTIGFVSRSSTTKQVTFNGFPVYTYSGDSGPAQNNGEGIAADGGTWGLASSKATTSGTTEIPPAVSTPTTTYHY